MPAFLRKTQDKLLNVDSSKKGFTLVELLVAISVIAILSTIGFTVFQDARTKALAAKTKADLDSIRKAYEIKFDPSANGGQGGYKPITDNDFANGQIPTPVGGGSYILVGSTASGSSPTPNFLACAWDRSGEACSFANATDSNKGTCTCVKSTGGVPIATSGGNGSGGCDVTGGISNGLVGYWKMDESSWTLDCTGATKSVKDSSINHLDARACTSGGVTPVLSQTSSANSSLATAGSFNRGSCASSCWSVPGSFIAVDGSSAFNLNTFTITAWIKVTGNCTNLSTLDQCTIVALSNGSTGATPYTLVVGYGVLSLYFGSPATNKQVRALNTVDNNWHHVAATYDGSAVKLYKDGAQETLNASFPGNVGSVITDSTWTSLANIRFAIGGRSINNLNNGYQFFPGYIDDVRIYNRALSPEDIVKVKDNPAVPCQ